MVPKYGKTHLFASPRHIVLSLEEISPQRMHCICVGLPSDPRKPSPTSYTYLTIHRLTSVASSGKGRVSNVSLTEPRYSLYQGLGIFDISLVVYDDDLYALPKIFIYHRKNVLQNISTHGIRLSSHPPACISR